MLPKEIESYYKTFLEISLEELAEMKQQVFEEYHNAICPDFRKRSLEYYKELSELLRFRLSLNYLIRNYK